LPALFAITLFLSAFLLFLVQPMVAKMLLPLLGGTPAVWNTCMVFFQAALLAGYAYAHAVAARCRLRTQVVLQALLLLVPLGLLLARQATFGVSGAPPASAYPVGWLLKALVLAVGLPFFVLATSAPLLQKWFASTTHASAKDPYFLYTASNAGSMLALLSYPFLLEPTLPLTEQSRLWVIGYAVLVVLGLACGLVVWRAGSGDPRPALGDPRPVLWRAGSGDPRPALGDPRPALADQRAETDQGQGLQPPALRHPTLRDRLRWVELAFVPSSLMLSVTTYLTADIAAIPLLWVIPLAFYLFTFILVFARRPPLSQFWMARIMPFLVLLITIIMLSQATEPVWLILPVHLIVFFVAAMVCHGELARQRPDAAHLTSFYLCLSLGGVLGGVFNALAAPLLFSSAVEYPLVLVLACLMRPALEAGDEAEQHGDEETRRQGEQETRDLSLSPGPLVSLRRFSAAALGLDIGLPLLVTLLAACLVIGAQRLGMEHGPVSIALMFGLPGIICYTFLSRTLRFALGIAALFVAGAFYQGVYGGTILRARSFFGIHRVTEDNDRHILVHGNTVHGQQNMTPEHRREALTYYFSTGPIGQVFRAFSGKNAKKEIAIVGLGAGSLAAYGEAGQHMTFYEIDPVVERIARDPRYFTFLQDSPADIDIVLGDARLMLRAAADHQYDMIIVDAFSSDSIPLHLLTREAVQLYTEKLVDDGVLIFNVSNRYLDLEPVLGDLAADAGLLCLWQDDLAMGIDRARGKFRSKWVIMARRKQHFARLAGDLRWFRVTGEKGPGVWRDDFSNLLSVFRWVEEP
jgi:hypothetical protein